MPEPSIRPPRPPADIVVVGARTHNLKDVDVTIPGGRFVIVTGVSGSGKSSLAFDTVYAEGQRRYVESLSAYARQFLERMEKPEVDRIDGIAPAIAIRQKNAIRNPRSTVGTTTEIHDYLRLLYARVGRTFCRVCGDEVVRESPEAVTDRVLALGDGARVMVGFELPLVVDEETARYAAVATALDGLQRRGFGRLLIDGRGIRFDDLAAEPSAAAAVETSGALQVVVDRLQLGAGDARQRLTDAVETAYREGGGAAWVAPVGADGAVAMPFLRFSERFECRRCDVRYEVPQPRLFSFNNPFGACPTCHGFGNVVELDVNLVVPDASRSIDGQAIEPWRAAHHRAAMTELKRVAKKADVRLDVPWAELTDRERAFVIDGDGRYGGVRGFFRGLERKKYKVHVRVFLAKYRGYQTCPECGGARLRREARDVRVGGRTIDEVSSLTVEQVRTFLDGLSLTRQERDVSDKIVREIARRLTFLADVGLEYLTLDRLSSTLSGGEAQRINLATSLGAALVGTLYVLDEPSVGLHPRDNLRLIAILRQLRDQGNTVLVVEHDTDMITVADYIIDMGLGAGEQGGRLVCAGTLEELRGHPRSLTARYLRQELAIAVPAERRRGIGRAIQLRGASEHNLKHVDMDVPLGALTCVTGVSGSGKSTLVHDVLYAAVKRAKGDWDRRVGAHASLDGLEYVSDVVLVDQQPIGRTPRSNPVTYLKAFDPIRELFAATKDARARGYPASHFSFNVPGGRCEACQGEGVVRVEMQFLADVFVPCDECQGRRFKAQVLEVLYKGRSVHEVLDLTVREALAFFAQSPKVLRRLQVLDEIGLGYLRLGQPATTLSGGEAQRIKIAAHLASQSGERLLYIMDEPTTGLHFDDIAKLLAAFRKLLEAGHTLLVIEHNLDVIKTADWVIDLGPDGGERGGTVVAVGTPEQVATQSGSVTGRYIQTVLAEGRARAMSTVEEE